MAKNKDRKSIILVLGMHRSATSLTAMLLDKMGCYMGEEQDFLPPEKCNERGFYEYEEAVHLNDEILVENDLTWASVKRGELELKTKKTEQIDRILQCLMHKAEKKDLAIKDPRMCILEPLWKKEIQKFDLQERVIVVFRHPFEVASSIEKRDNINFTYGIKLWFFYICQIFENIRTIPKENILFLHHDEYFVNVKKQVGKVVDFLGVSKDNAYYECIDQSLRHNKAEQLSKNLNVALEKMVLELYEVLISLSKQEKSLDEVDINKYKKNLKEILSNSYLPNQEDSELFAFGRSNAWFLKQWCIYQLTENREKVKERLKEYFGKNDIEKLDIYGNGTLAQALYPVLMEMGLEVGNIFDCNSEQQVIISEKVYKVQALNEGKNEKNAVILNTVLVKELEIEETLVDIYGTDNVISLYRLLYGMRKDCYDEIEGE